MRLTIITLLLFLFTVFLYNEKNSRLKTFYNKSVILPSNSTISTLTAILGSEHEIMIKRLVEACPNAILLTDNRFVCDKKLNIVILAHYLAFESKNTGEQTWGSGMIKSLEFLGAFYFRMSQDEIDKIKFFFDVFGKKLKVITHPNTVKKLKEKHMFSWKDSKSLMCQFYIPSSWDEDEKDFDYFPQKNILVFISPPFNRTNINYMIEPCNVTSAPKKDGFIGGKWPGQWTNGEWFAGVNWNCTVYTELRKSFPEILLYSQNQGAPPEIKVVEGGMDRSKYINFLSSKLFYLGAGSTTDNPSTFEALSCGVPYINPVFKPNIDVYKRKKMILDGTWVNSTTAKQKRALINDRVSQHRFTEFFTEPYVYHVYYKDTNGLLEAVRKIIKHGPIKPFLPKEFTKDYVFQSVKEVLDRDGCVD